MPSSRMLGAERARVALELVLAGAVVDHRAHRVVDLHELVDARAALIALLVGRSSVERRRSRGVDVQQPALVLARAVRHARRRVEHAHEPLRQHADQARRQQERLDAHVAQARHRADGGVRVQRRQHEVARQARLHRDLGRLEVADLADHHDVGVLAQDCAQAACEGHLDLRVHLRLADAVDVVLDRILDRQDVAREVVDALERRVQRRRLAGARRAR